MERHDTHLLSCSSSVEHSYKFDKNGNIISDSVSEMPYSKITNKKKYKINTADIFNNINKNTKISQEENINQDNNMNSKEIQIPSLKNSQLNNNSKNNNNKNLSKNEHSNNSHNQNNNAKNNSVINLKNNETNNRGHTFNGIGSSNNNSNIKNDNNIEKNNLKNIDNNMSVSQIINDKKQKINGNNKNNNEKNNNENNNDNENNKNENKTISKNNNNNEDEKKKINNNDNRNKEMDKIINNDNVKQNDKNNNNTNLNKSKNNNNLNNENNNEQKNDKNNKNGNNFKIIESKESFMYLPFEKESNNNNNHKNENKNNNKSFKVINENKEKKNNDINNTNQNNHNNIKIKKEAEFTYSLKKYDNKLLKVNNIESFFLKAITTLKNQKQKEKSNEKHKNQNNEKINNKDKDDKDEENQNEINNNHNNNLIKENMKEYEFSPKFIDRMKFSSKTNSFLPSLNNIVKEKDIIIEKTNIEKDMKLPLNNICFIVKSPSIIVKYKKFLYNVRNSFCFYTKEITNTEKYKNTILRGKIGEKKKHKKVKESIMFDQFNNKNNNLDKVIKNKFKLNDKDKNIINNKGDNNDNDNDNYIDENDENTENKVNSNINNISTENNFDANINKKNSIIRKKNNNEYNEDGDNISLTNNNDQNKKIVNNNNNKFYHKDNNDYNNNNSSHNINNDNKNNKDNNEEDDKNEEDKDDNNDYYDKNEYDDKNKYDDNNKNNNNKEYENKDDNDNNEDNENNRDRDNEENDDEDKVNLENHKNTIDNFNNINNEDDHHNILNKDINNHKGNKSDFIKKNKKNYLNNDNFEEYAKVKNMIKNYNHHINNNTNDNEKEDISKKINNTKLITPRKIIQKTNYNILKPISILRNKANKVPNSAYPTITKKKGVSSDYKNSNISKTTSKLTGITTPSTLIEKRLFNDSHLTNVRRVKNTEKKNRNRSLLNIINSKDNSNLDHTSPYKDDIYHDIHDIHCIHLPDELGSNSKKKYSRHFGKEENCPICVALQMKNKLLEEKNKMLPILTKNNFRKNADGEKNKSPSKDKIMKTIYPKNKEKRLIRIGSGTSVLTMKKNLKRRNESVKQLRKIEITSYLPNEKETDDERFPVIKDYFN